MTAQNTQEEYGLDLRTEILCLGVFIWVLYGSKLTSREKIAFFHLWRTVAAPETFFTIIIGLVPPGPWSGGVLGVEGAQIS